MQPAGGIDGGGLARFQSAPVKWLEALLLSDDDDMMIEPPQSTFNHHPSITTTNFGDPGVILPSSDNVFLRRNKNCSPVGSDNYFSSNEIPVNAKELRVVDLEDSKSKFTTRLDPLAFSVRAKRGFATHPRSIAERARRTRISDRIRKLQELVPNMDKQTNTADMLEEAVEYVTFLQNQIQDLTERQNKCTCYS